MVACAAGCGNLLGIDNFSLGDAGASDGRVADAPSDGGDACYGPTGWQLCFARPPTGAITLSNETFDTDSNPACEPANPWTNAAQPVACVIASGTILVSKQVNAVGARPLVLLATDTIDISGTLDIAHGGSAGTRAACNPFATAPGVNGLDDGGGAGGSLISSGGNGGNGGAGTAGGTVAAAVGVPDTLVGGCPGQAGGGTGAGGGVSGPGGGAVFIDANNGLTISGTINASGWGGGGGSAGGGGGGGSGGTILIYASAISATGATLIANGGGGGGGFSNTPGLKGSDPDPTMPNTPALGGAGGGTGGSGFASATAATAGSPSNNGGGGGGGGASGTIDTNVATSGGVIPGATTSPIIGQMF